MELNEGITSPAYRQASSVMKDGVKKKASAGTSIQLSVMLSTSTYKNDGDGFGRTIKGHTT